MKYEVAATTSGYNPVRKNQPLDSSGMEIPDYVIERMAKCLLPLMRRHFENMEGKNLQPDTSCTECVT